nr:hypothetical protein TIFTF001_043638 [Ficus carica]
MSHGVGRGEWNLASGFNNLATLTFQSPGHDHIGVVYGDSGGSVTRRFDPYGAVKRVVGRVP